jgi:hypothetical protein
MEVSNRQQIRLPLGQPGPRGCALAPWAVPVAAAVVGDAQVPTVLASLDMATKCCRAAGLDRCLRAASS